MSIRRVRELLAASLVVIASFAAASAAEAQSVITGRITDAQGNGIPAANVVVPTLGVGVGASTNATGNFTKVVQRVPVKIAIEDSSLSSQLRPGLSAVVTVRTRH